MIIHLFYLFFYFVGFLVQTTSDLNIRAKYSSILSETYALKQYLLTIPLDSTETIKQLTGTTTIKDGVMSGGSAFITSHSWDNTKDWELSCELAYSGTQSALCIVDSTATTRDRKTLKVAISSHKFVEYNAGGSYNEIDWSGMNNANTYYPVIIRKQNNKFTLIIDGNTFEKTSSYIISNSSNVCVGIDYWGSGSCSIKNIRVKEL